MTTLTPAFTKTIRYDRITHDYRAELDEQLIGYYPNYHAAEVALDRVAYDLLADGLAYTAAELDAPAAIHTTADGRYVCQSCGRASSAWFCPACNDDCEPTDTPALLVNWNSVAADPPIDPLPTDAPGGDDEETGPYAAFPICKACHTAEYPPSAMQSAFCTECVNAMLHGLANRLEAAQFAFTRQSIQIEATMRRCHHCGADHRTWQCPEIHQRLRAPETPADRLWIDIALGRELCRMKWRNFRAFVALLLSVPTEHLVIYAASYQAYVRSHAPDSDLTINQVLQAWTRDMRRGGDRGPAAAMKAA